MILPFIITGSTHLWNLDDPSFQNYGIKSLRSYQRSFLSELWDLGLYGVTNDPSFWNYGINTVVELRQSFLLELRDQHTFSSTEVTGSILNWGSRMIQSYYLLDDRSSPDPFWTKVQGWYNPTTFSMTEITKSLMDVTPRFWPHLHDVYNVINRGEELKAKAPPSIWLCMFRQWG